MRNGTASSAEREVARDFYRDALDVLDAARVPFLVGGAYAFARYTGVSRFTKDFDIFVLSSDRDRALDELRRAGYPGDVTFDHWLAKVHSGDLFVDIIYSAGNGVAVVDHAWFEHAVEGEVLGARVWLVPPEEMIWSKAFIMERERFDGADVLHLLRACAEELDWDRLLARFGGHWRVLFSHLLLFGFAYPAERNRIPLPVMREMLARVQADLGRRPPDGRICRGTLLSREQYLVDVEEWGYQDARLVPHGTMTPEQTARWTAAIDEDE